MAAMSMLFCASALCQTNEGAACQLQAGLTCAFVCARVLALAALHRRHRRHHEGAVVTRVALVGVCEPAVSYDHSVGGWPTESTESCGYKVLHRCSVGVTSVFRHRVTESCQPPIANHSCPLLADHTMRALNRGETCYF
eukprot:4724460-Prymnesium_polylepis.1